jgi:hypothetical protein
MRPTPSSEERRRPQRSAPRPSVRPIDDDLTERIRLIEFIWTMRPGRQSVLLVDREWLH